jgi:hypothetical protein
VQLDVGSSADVNFEAAGPGYTPVDGVGDKAVVYMSTSKGNSIASVTAVKGTRSVTLTASSALPEEDAKQRAIEFVKDVLDD